ncbi:MAG: hypothetical protein IT566_17840 [Rhodospirillaceae bacterium]|nr:hypothetical protein [Rhodospirillaceae bacterium]
MNASFARGGQQYYGGNQEPCLTDMLADPVFLAVLRRDGLTVANLLTQLGLPKKWADQNGELRAPTMAAA